MANTSTRETAAQRRDRERKEEAARAADQAAADQADQADRDDPLVQDNPQAAADREALRTDDSPFLAGDTVVHASGEEGRVTGYNGEGKVGVKLEGQAEVQNFPANELTLVGPEIKGETTVKAEVKGKSKSKNKALIPVPLDLLGESEDVPEEEWTEVPLSVPEERDAAQLVIDKEVKDAYDKWVAAGKPHAVKSPRKRRLANPEHAPAIRQMIGKAARLHKVTAVLSKPSFNADGKEIIVFSVRDKAPARNRKADADLQAIREWANKQGDENMHVAERGRIPEEVKEAFYKANPDKVTADVTTDKAEDTASKNDEAYARDYAAAIANGDSEEAAKRAADTQAALRIAQKNMADSQANDKANA
jgi:hypothetical protein